MRSLFLTFLFCLVSVLESFGQNPELDSLWASWINTKNPDSSRLNAIDKYIWSGFLMSNPDSAYSLAQLHFNYAEKIGDTAEMALAKNTMGVTFNLRGEFEKSILYYESSINIYKSISDYEGVSMIHNNLGLSYWNMGEFEQALYYFEKSLEQKKETGKKKHIANTLQNIGLVHYYLGNFREAISYIEKSLEINLSIDSKKGLGNCYNNLGLLYKSQGNFKKAEEYYLNSKMLYESIHDKYGLSYVYSNLSGVYRSLGDTIQQKEYLDQSLNLAREIQNKEGIALGLGNLGLFYADLGMYDTSIYYFQKSLEINQEIGDFEGVAFTCNALALQYSCLGEFNKALKFNRNAYETAVRIGVNSNLIDATKTFFKIYLEIDSLDQAVDYLNQNTSLMRKGIFINYPTLTEYEKEKYLISISKSFEFVGEFALAHQEFKSEQIRVFNTALLTKGLSLRSSTLMKESILNSGDTSLIREYKDWIKVKKRIAERYAEGTDYASLEGKAQNIESSLLSKSEMFRAFSEIEHTDWQDVKKSLKPGEIVVDIIQFDQKTDVCQNEGQGIYYAAVLLGFDYDYPKTVGLCFESELNKVFSNASGRNVNSINKLYGTLDEGNSTLYNLVWKPIDTCLEKIRTVYLSPVGLLHRISFSAICKEKNVLIGDLYKINLISSTGNLVNRNVPKLDKNSSFLLFGGIDYDTDSSQRKIWPYLEGTLKEIKTISKLLKDEEHQIYTGSNATEGVFKSSISNGSVLHVATHGFFYNNPDEENALLESSENEEDLVFRGGDSGIGYDAFVKSLNPLMRSGLVFAGANDVWRKSSFEGEDGVLSAQEVATLDLRKTDLVVLSACETGLGDIKGNEGVYGLQRAFKMAGVKYIIMSLWQVPDKETAEFMTKFYQNLIETRDIKYSFNVAQMKMREKYDPYFWAAFVLIE